MKTVSTEELMTSPVEWSTQSRPRPRRQSSIRVLPPTDHIVDVEWTSIPITLIP